MSFTETNYTVNSKIGLIAKTLQNIREKNDRSVIHQNHRPSMSRSFKASQAFDS